MRKTIALFLFLFASTAFAFGIGSGEKALFTGYYTIVNNVLTAESEVDISIIPAPVISGVAVSGITETSATVSWTTNEAATSQIAYGIVTNPYPSITLKDGSLVTAHSQTLTGLTAGTLYHYKVMSENQYTVLAESLDSTFTTTAGPIPTPPQAFIWGVDGHFWDQYTNPVTESNLVKELGSTTYRIDMRNDQYARADAILANGVDMVAIIGGTNNDYQASYNEAFKFASRYARKIKYYQVSNESDVASGAVAGNGELPSDYNTTGYNIQKVKIQGLIDGIRAADPNAKTIVNFTWLHYGFIQRLINDGIKFDIVGIDWYWDDITAVHGNKNLPQIVKNAFGKPIWITEGNRTSGSFDGNEQAQADYITATATAMRANPNIDAYFIYELLDEPKNVTPTERKFGIMSNLTTKKPAFDAYKNVILGDKPTPCK